MGRRQPVRRSPLIGDRKPHWFVTLLRTILIAIVAYFVAAFVYLVLAHISTSPHGPLWDSAFEGPFLFIMMIVVVGGLSVPFFQKEWDPGLRTFSMFAAVFLVGYAVFHGSTIVDPDIPLRFVVTHVFLPFRRATGY